MPRKPLRPCNYPGCPNLSENCYCEKHRKIIQSEANKRYDENKRDSGLRKFYASAEWKKLRQLKLQQSPMCEICYSQGKISKANIVDHVRPIKEYPDGKLDISNLQSVCMSCHSRKTRNEEADRYNKKGEDKDWKF